MNSQYEINVEHSEALDAADRAFLLKTAVKELAARQGMVATFMGKPFNDQGGSGFHVHLSLARDDGTQRLRRRRRPHGLGTLRAQFVAGLLEHGPALMALLAPTVNAYKRLVPDSLAPTHVNWGSTTAPRSCACRTSTGRGAASRCAAATAARHRISSSLRSCSRGSTGSSASSSSGTRLRRRLPRRVRGRRCPATSARRSMRSRPTTYLRSALGEASSRRSSR